MRPDLRSQCPGDGACGPVFGTQPSSPRIPRHPRGPGSSDTVREARDSARRYLRLQASLAHQLLRIKRCELEDSRSRQGAIRVHDQYAVFAGDCLRFHVEAVEHLTVCGLSCRAAPAPPNFY